MENLNQYALNKRYAEDTGNRVDPSAESFKTGIEFKSEARSNILNGSFYLLSQAIQYLQFTGGLYDNNASYNEGNIVSCLVKDVDKYRLWRFRRNSNNAGTLTGNAPITGGSVESVNGVDVYVLGSVSSDWDKLEDFNYSSEATPNFIISRDNEGSAKVKMPSSVVDDTIVNKSYLQAKNISSTGIASNVQEYLDGTKSTLDSMLLDIVNLQKRLTIPPYYIQFANASGVFDSKEAPNTWYQNQFSVSTTWELMFNTESVYFRTEGSLASSGRISGKQEDAIREITGIIYATRLVPGGAYGGFYTEETNDPPFTINLSSRESKNIGFRASKNVPTANENRTVNRLIRVYRLLTMNGVNVR